MTQRMQTLLEAVTGALGEKLLVSSVSGGELTIEVAAADIRSVAVTLRDDTTLAFEQLIDLCGVDYLDYGKEKRGYEWRKARFAVVYHLLSVKNNQRLRVRCFIEDESMPTIDSVIEEWAAADWFEREAFDLFGIIFVGHPDLRRILTDYGFIGHPFRKDFPVSGHVEMRYDPEQKRVIYEPVSIDPRVLVPRVIREEGFGG